MPVQLHPEMLIKYSSLDIWKPALCFSPAELHCVSLGKAQFARAAIQRSTQIHGDAQIYLLS